MTVRVVNLRSDETYHFYEWIRRHSDVAGMIALAKEKDNADEEPSVEGVRDNLACLVEDRLNETIGDGTEYGPCMYVEADEEKSLINPLLELAARRIDCEAVAEALLAEAGKSVTDPGTPEIA
jgi:hypothetical protein